MSITKKTVFAVACDRCGEDFTSMGYGTEHFDDEGAAIDAITDYDWLLVSADVFCPDCASKRKPTGCDT